MMPTHIPTSRLRIKTGKNQHVRPLSGWGQGLSAIGIAGHNNRSRFLKSHSAARTANNKPNSAG
jgi:hypothetical protein